MVVSFARAMWVAIRSRFHHLVRVSTLGAFVLMIAYSAFPVHAAPGAEPKPATAATQAYLAQFSASLPFADREDFYLATRGFVAAVPGHRILDAEGHLLRSLWIAKAARASRGFGLDRTRCQRNTRVEARTSLAVSVSEESEQLQPGLAIIHSSLILLKSVTISGSRGSSLMCGSG